MLQHEISSHCDISDCVLSTSTTQLRSNMTPLGGDIEFLRSLKSVIIIDKEAGTAEMRQTLRSEIGLVLIN